MIFVAVGISHKTTKIDVREKFYLSTTERELLLSELKQEPVVAEALVLSTCNRTEIYCLMSEAKESVLIRKLCGVKGIALNDSLKRNFYTYFDDKAIRHLMCVAAGLDSLVVGEKQILGQLKLAVELAREKNMLGRFLNVLSNLTIRTGKKARHETKICAGGSSVSWAAVQRAEQHYGSLKGKKVLIIGAGKMSELAAGDFTRKGVGELLVMNRTQKKGEELARRFKGASVGFDEIKEVLGKVDVCIVSASAPHYLIETELISRVMNSYEKKELVLVDISMPRNIHPEAARLENVTLISLDELDQVVSENINQRLEAVYEVEAIINDKIVAFKKKLAAAEARNNKVRSLRYVGH